MKVLSLVAIISTFVIVVSALPQSSYRGSGYSSHGGGSKVVGSGYRNSGGYGNDYRVGGGYRVGGYRGNVHQGSGYQGSGYRQGSGYGSPHGSGYGSPHGSGYGSPHGSGYGYKKVLCSKLVSPANGQVKLSGIKPGDKAVYSCDTGFVLVGIGKVRKCLPNGKWSQQAPSCKRINCGPLPDIANGAVDIKPDTRYLSTATYSCNYGFNLVGEATRTCQANGQYSGAEPSCTPVDCGDLSKPDNGWVHISPNTLLGGVGDYRCKLGYEITVGYNRITCQPSGQYDNPPPTCEPISCPPPPPASANGQIASSAGSSLRDETTYSCNSGFYLVGSATIYCQNDKTYSDSAPECKRVDCGAPDPADPNGALVVSSTTYESVTTYSCNDGYILVGESVSTCQANAEWSSEAPTCKPVDCGKLPAPKNGAVSFYPGTTLTSTASFACRKGFRLVGSQYRSCQTNGKWSGVQPVCKRITCPKVSPPKNGKVYISGIYPGDRLHYDCSYGFKLTGPNRRTCLHTGKWSGNDADCVKDPSYYQHDTKYGHHGGADPDYSG